VTDLRHGVTEIQHRVLDLLDPTTSDKCVRNAAHGHDTHLFLAEKLVNYARVNVSMRFKRDHAIEAAAHLIDVAEQLDAMIAAGDA
jgi:hypothetical protein